MKFTDNRPFHAPGVLRMKVHTDEYKWTHGKIPRGEGNWAFYVGNDETPVFFRGKFSEAKKLAIELALKRGEDSIKVGT